MILPALLALCASAYASPSFAPLDKVRAWPVYDAPAAGEVDLGGVCRLARLPCGVVVPKDEELSASSGPIAGLTVGALLERVLAAHPGYAAEMREGVLFVGRAGDGCAASLDRPAAAAHHPPGSARVAALLVLRESGWPAFANAALASLTGDQEDARYQRVDTIVHRGATVRGALDAIARGDGRMLWRAESDGKSCTAFRFRSWRAPQPLEGASVLVSVSGPTKGKKSVPKP